MMLDIASEDRGWSRLRGRDRLARRAVETVFAIVGTPAREVEISILFSSDEKVADLNRTWRGKTGPTNVLSFPTPAGVPLPPGLPTPLGDIVLAYGVVAREAESQRKPLASHVSHLIVHGLLHLLGHQHDVEEDAEAMRAIEVAAQTTLGYRDPYVGEPRRGPEAAQRR